MNTCMDLFHEQQSRRSLRPLRLGAYKLEERLHELRECGFEIERIQNFWSHKRSTYDLLHCTPHDAGIWLKAIPYQIATIMGYDILPAITALTNEGLDIKPKQKMAKKAIPVIFSIVLECDQLTNLIKNFPHWYREPTNQIYADLCCTVTESVKVIKSILDEYSLHVSHTSYEQLQYDLPISQT